MTLPLRPYTWAIQILRELPIFGQWVIMQTLTESLETDPDGMGQQYAAQLQLVWQQRTAFAAKGKFAFFDGQTNWRPWTRLLLDTLADATGQRAAEAVAVKLVELGFPGAAAAVRAEAALP